MTTWLAVTNDKYELPIAWGRTAEELAERIGRTQSAVSRMVRRCASPEGIPSYGTYKAYRVEEGDE